MLEPTQAPQIDSGCVYGMPVCKVWLCVRAAVARTQKSLALGFLP